MSAGPVATSTVIQPAPTVDFAALAELRPAERLSVLIEHRKLVQRVMEEAMVEGVHYGIIKDSKGRPISKRPTLYDPGALFLLFIWGLRGVPVFEHVEESFDPPHFVYVVRYDVYHTKSGLLVGCGYGAANSYEPQWYYRWVKADELPPGVAPDGLPKKVIRPAEGGKFEVYRILNPDLAALQNTIRKQAVVRARRDAALTVTASKDLFTQDLDEIPLPVEEVEEAVVVDSDTLPDESETPPQPKPQPPARRRRSTAGERTPQRPAGAPAATSQPAAQSSPGTAPASETQDRPVLPAEWAQLINEAAKRGWTQPAIAAAYKQVAGKSMDQRPTRQEFERLKQVLSQPGPASTEQLPF